MVLRRRGIATAYVPPISVVLATDRERYVRGLTDFRSGEVGSWIEQFAAAAWAVIEVLPAHPVITAPVAVAATGRARAAIHQAMKQLADCGVIVPLADSKRDRSWEAVGLLGLLEGLEPGRAPGSV